MRPAVLGPQPVASTSGASTSQPCRLFNARVHYHGSTRCRHVAPRRAKAERQAEEADLDREPADLAEFARLSHTRSRYPNMYDPNWSAKVEDWQEFWHGSDWDREDPVELDRLEDEYDAMHAKESPVARAYQLVEEMTNLNKRDDVMRILNTVSVHPSPYVVFNDADITPQGIRTEHNPLTDPWDLRAMMEKRRQRATLDREWRRRQNLVDKIDDKANRLIKTDVRLADWPTQDHWTDQMMEDLSHGYGEFVTVDKLVWAEENPLANTDFTDPVHGHEAAPETEDFINGIGHLLQDDEELSLEGVVLSEEDFGAGADIFISADDREYMYEAPNLWADQAGIDFVNRLREEGLLVDEDALAAAEEGEEFEVEGGDGGWDPDDADDVELLLEEQEDPAPKKKKSGRGRKKADA